MSVIINLVLLIDDIGCHKLAMRALGLKSERSGPDGGFGNLKPRSRAPNVRGDVYQEATMWCILS
jgi:hypothetical protein